MDRIVVTRGGEYPIIPLDKVIVAPDFRIKRSADGCLGCGCKDGCIGIVYVRNECESICGLNFMRLE